MMAKMCKVVGFVFLASAISAAPLVYADDCFGNTINEGVSPNGKYKVVPAIDIGGNSVATFTFFEKKENQYIEKSKGELGEMGHIHGRTYVSNEGDRFAVVNTSGGVHLEDRVIICSTDGKVVKKIGIADMSTKEEQKKVGLSISHIHWLKVKVNDKGVSDVTIVLDDKTNELILEPIWGGKVRIALKDGKVTKEEEKKEEKQKVEQGGITEEKAKEISLKAVDGVTFVTHIQKSADGKEWLVGVAENKSLSELFGEKAKITIDAVSGKVLKVDINKFRE